LKPESELAFMIVMIPNILIKMSSFVVEVLTGFVIIDKLLLKDIKCRDKK
jgi:hypothetical protein